MDLTKYQVFLKTVECGSFTAAAQQLSFTQSGVSHAISGLEEELGVTLLSRSRGGVTLTADGWALMPYIQEICRQQRNIEERAKDLQGLETGVVRVAVFTSVSVQWMPYILKSFREQYPNIEFELLPSNYNTEIARWIQDGTADCGFLVLPTEANLDCWLLQRDQWKAIVPWDHPLAGREPFPPEALTQYPFILLEEGDDYEIQEVLDTLGAEELTRMILDLREPYKTPCRLVLLEQHTMAEAARLCGRPEKTVNAQIYRAKKMLVQQIREQQEGRSVHGTV